jgi:hypothetical protein
MEALPMLISTNGLDVDKEGPWLDTLSNGDSDQPGQEEIDQGEWIQGKSIKIRHKKKTQVVATRHSSTLSYHGGRSIQEMAATRKKLHNLETPGIKQANSFAILNDVEDNVLLQTAKDVEISLNDNEEGCRNIISTMKAEERVRANLAEANYRAYLENMKNRERVQEDDILDMTINSHRGLNEESDSNPRVEAKNARNHKLKKTRKK